MNPGAVFLVIDRCQLEHCDAWKRSPHSPMLRDTRANKDVIITTIYPEIIKAHLKKIENRCGLRTDPPRRVSADARAD